MEAWAHPGAIKSCCATDDGMQHPKGHPRSETELSLYTTFLPAQTKEQHWKPYPVGQRERWDTRIILLMHSRVLSGSPLLRETARLCQSQIKSLKDGALKKKKKKKQRRRKGERGIYVCEMEALSGVFWGDKELGGPISAWHGLTHCLWVSQERAEGAADICA